MKKKCTICRTELSNRDITLLHDVCYKCRKNPDFKRCDDCQKPFIKKSDKTLCPKCTDEHSCFHCGKELTTDEFRVGTICKVCRQLEADSMSDPMFEND